MGRLERGQYMDDDIEDREKASRESGEESLREFEYSVELLIDEFYESSKNLIDDAAYERGEIWREKEAIFRHIEDMHVKDKHKVSTGVLCSVGVATLIAEYLGGPYGDPTDTCFEGIESMYAFTLAIRADGLKWPYLRFFAMKNVNLFSEWRTSRGDDYIWYSKIARPLLGEICRLIFTSISRLEVIRLTGYNRFQIWKSATCIVKVFEIGIKFNGPKWFRSYLKSPLVRQRESRAWLCTLTTGGAFTSGERMTWPQTVKFARDAMPKYIEYVLSISQPTRFDQIRNEQMGKSWFSNDKK